MGEPATRARFVAPLVVALVVVAITWGSGLTVGGAAGAPIDVAAGVRVRTPAGWTASPAPLPAPWQGVRFTRGPDTLTAAAAAGLAGSPVDVLDAYARQVIDPTIRSAVFGEVGTVTVASGRQAATVGYVGTSPEGIPVEGVAVALLGGPGGVVVDGVAPKGDLGAIADDLRGLVASVEVT
ncbi:MAG TPA: hypothetical protein VE032_04565 [Actinomycetota bacterium]|nr:hypothetical protein [Actinomycetota bacterium]